MIASNALLSPPKAVPTSPMILLAALKPKIPVATCIKPLASSFTWSGFMLLINFVNCSMPCAADFTASPTIVPKLFEFPAMSLKLDLKALYSAVIAQPMAWNASLTSCTAPVAEKSFQNVFAKLDTLLKPLSNMLKALSKIPVKSIFPTPSANFVTKAMPFLLALSYAFCSPFTKFSFNPSTACPTVLNWVAILVNVEFVPVFSMAWKNSSVLILPP